MKNLTRYAAPYVKLNDRDDCGMMPDVNGEWVKFSDYLEGVRERAPNISSVPCPSCGGKVDPISGDVVHTVDCFS